MYLPGSLNLGGTVYVEESFLGGIGLKSSAML